MSELLDILGCRYPIIQGPIGTMNDPKFVAAISEAGAFGMLALGFSTVEQAKRLAGEVRSLTEKPFGASIMIINPDNLEILQALAEMGVKTVTTSAGSPAKIYPLIHHLGMRGFHVLLSMPHAVRAEKEGADGVVISGVESGGLRSLARESTTMILVPLVADNVSLPIIATGGIVDRRGFRAALALGAQGVQLGTRLLTAEECPAPRAWKEAILNCGDGGTTLLPLGNMKMRVITNKKLSDLMANPKIDLTKEYNMLNAPRGWMKGDFDLFPAGAGQSAALIREIKPVKDIIEEMVS